MLHVEINYTKRSKHLLRKVDGMWSNVGIGYEKTRKAKEKMDRLCRRGLTAKRK